MGFIFLIVLQCYGFKINQRMAIPVEAGCHWLIIFFCLLKLRLIHFSVLYTFFFLANILFIQVSYISTAEFVTMFCITFLDVVNGVCKCCKGRFELCLLICKSLVLALCQAMWFIPNPRFQRERQYIILKHGKQAIYFKHHARSRWLTFTMI